ncbi:MAG: hypothetical protein CVU44_07275 [Chloroflexi bacterium HGW-Chloroflexi-6]|nr:MAG: hypothetical protein CVU44_07275 [Chloroflexi bacterium HGW-Chloroflexi-6]
MYNHAPGNYNCPFCLLIQGIKNEHVHSIQSDIVYHDSAVTAFVSSHQWPNNHGNTIIVPNQHFENIYDLPLSYAGDIQRIAKRLAIAMKEVYACDGVSTRQHNEPAGGQDVWHYHLHVTPRYENDNYYGSQREFMPIAEREMHASALKKLLESVELNEIFLRDVENEDLSIFFEHQLDPEANHMAAFAAKDPTNREAFHAHWRKILADPSVIMKTIVCNGQVAGSVSSYEEDGKPEVTYWLGKEHWGKGLATQALAEFLMHHNKIRPIYARTAKDNLGSRRVLEKCGFTVIDETKGFANARNEEIEELLLELRTL